MRVLTTVRGRRLVPKLANERGVAAVTVAIALLVLMGMGAYAIDGSNLYRERGDAQNAADLAAYAAAYEECTGGSPADAIAAGESQATANGYTTGPNAVVTVVKDGSAWRATVDTDISGHLSRVFGANTLNTGATALAECTPGTGSSAAIFAGGQCGTNPTFDVGGDRNEFNGDLHSNGNLKWQGADLNHVTGAASYVDPYYEVGNVYTNNTWDQGFPTQKPWQRWPVAMRLNPADYANNGPVESLYSNPDRFFEYSGDTTIGSSTPNGVHVIRGDGKFTISSNNLAKSLTLVILPTSSDKGSIEISGNGHNITAFHDDVLFYTEFWKGGTDYPYNQPPYPNRPECGAPAIQQGGNNSTFTGLLVSPRGMIEWNGNFNTLNGGLAGFNVKYNGNDNTMNTLPGSGSGDPTTVLVQ